MQDRRTFLGAAAASLLPFALEAQTSPRAPSGPTELARHALSGPLDGFEIVLLELTSPAGSRSTGPGHRHPGPVLGYVTEGQMLFGINNQPEQAVPTGSTFFEPTGAVHTSIGSATSDAPARALVFMVIPRGSALTSPA
jgi:quercetin dioxygenase-like cupin family protein